MDCKCTGIDIEFKGSGTDEIGVVIGVSGDLAPKVTAGQKIIKIDKRYFRPAKVETLLGDPTKAKATRLEPTISAQDDVKRWLKRTIK